MTEKKATTTKKKVAAPKTAAKKAAAKKVEVTIDEVSVGYHAGDVYQALNSAEKPMSVAEIAKAAKITTEETYLSIGWLLREGKVKGEANLFSLA